MFLQTPVVLQLRRTLFPWIYPTGRDRKVAESDQAQDFSLGAVCPLCSQLGGGEGEREGGDGLREMLDLKVWPFLCTGED